MVDSFNCYLFFLGGLQREYGIFILSVPGHKVQEISRSSAIDVVNDDFRTSLTTQPQCLMA